MEEETHQLVEKTQCDKNNNNQIVDAALKENILPTTEENTGQDQEIETETEENKKDGGSEETNDKDEKGQHQIESQDAKDDTEQDSQDNTADNVAASEAVSTSADNTDCNAATEDETMKEKQQESTNKQENTPTNNEEKVEEVVPNKAEKKKTGKDSEVKSEGNKKGKTEGAEKPAKKKPSASSLAALSRPRVSARSSRASNKKDIIAKFQQGAPETPVPRNFKLQRSAAAGSTGASIKQKILQWCISKTRKYEGVTIENFSSSWCDGMAFCALIHRFFPDAFDFSSLNPKEKEKNFTLAFQTAETLADCCPLLDVSDMLLMGDHPDPMCIFTYVQSLCHSLSKIEKERKDKAEKENADKKEEEGPQEETDIQDSGTSEGAEVINEDVNESNKEETSEKEEDVSKSAETDIQATVEVES